MGLREGSGAWLKSGQAKGLCQPPIPRALSFYQQKRSSTQFHYRKKYGTTISSLFCPFSSFSPGTEWFIWCVNLELRTGSGGWVHFGPCFWSARLWRGTGCSPSRTSESAVWEVRQGEQICLIQGESHQSMGPQSTSHCFQPTIIKITY